MAARTGVRAGSRAGKSDPLATYRAKRSPARTPEPFGGAAGAPAGEALLFVVQKHSARRLHYDFRLEWGGVLKSWAVPKGPSFDPGDRALAVETEDHPLDYANFEGLIPAGEYGGGPVIVWDRGRWIPIEPPDEGLRRGKLLFDLEGYKLRGRWTLVRTGPRRSPGKEWLLIKHRDEFAGGPRPSDESILSGLTVEEVGGGRSPRQAIERELERLGAPRRPVEPADVTLMLAELHQQPFSRKGWIFELKYDGFRLLVARDREQARILYRRGAEVGRIFPEIARAAAALPFERLVLDGEVVVLDEQGRPSFQRLQKRVQLVRETDVSRAAVELPATVFLFDCLACEGFDLRPLPLVERKRLLREIVPNTGPLRCADHVEERGLELFHEIRGRDLEGMVAKRGDAPYRGGRSPDWQKIRLERTADFAVVGFTRPKGARHGFGALQLAVTTDRGFRYAGRVGTGFSESQLAEVSRRLEGARVPRPPASGAPTAAGDVWVEPEIVCEVRFREWTEDGLLRQPVFLRFRDDKTARECCADERLPDLADAAASQEVSHQIPFSNLDKVFWPEDGFRKRDLVEYYRAVAPAMLPYLRDRPLVLTRFPDGITGKSFFQKDAPKFVPDWIRTEKIWSDDSERDLAYFVCESEDTLLYLANLGTIPIHVWASRLADLDRPDWSILDLDPKTAPFAHVVDAAVAIRRLCDEIELPSYPKTSGATGLHVLVPLGGQLGHEESRTLAELLCRVVAEEMPDRVTLERRIAGRAGRVYLDFLQNGRGKTIVSPFSARPVPGAGVSTPLEWPEVNARLDPRRFHIRSVPRRLAKKGTDPLRLVLEQKPDLSSALARLAERLERAERKTRRR